MKKFICMLTVLLCSVMNLSAQDYNLEGRWVEGRWVTDLSDEGESTTLIFLFEGNELTQAVYSESNVDGVGLVGVIIATPPAPFKLEGNKLTVSYDASQAEYQVMKTEYTDKVKEVIKQAPSMENTMKEILDNAFNSQKEEMCKTVMFKGGLEIVSYNDDGEMTIKDTDGETYTFYLKGE